jgi:dethiobiotin synthetase
MPSIIFITGTGTGVGKTVATGALLHELRRKGVRALAIKPFCTGGLADVRHLRRLQDNELSAREINPFFYRQPLAPFVASRGRSPSLQEAVLHIRAIGERCDVLLVEGAGGLLVPLGIFLRNRNRNLNLLSSSRLTSSPHGAYTAADLISELDCGVIVVARNKLGTLNHTLLTVRALPESANSRAVVLLMGQRRPDLSAGTNPRTLARLLQPVKVVTMPYLGQSPLSPHALITSRAGVGKLLAQLQH